jgi:hypothetical protein
MGPRPFPSARRNRRPWLVYYGYLHCQAKRGYSEDFMAYEKTPEILTLLMAAQ